MCEVRITSCTSPVGKELEDMWDQKPKTPPLSWTVLWQLPHQCSLNVIPYRILWFYSSKECSESLAQSNFIPPLYFDIFHLPFWSVYSFWWTLLTITRLKQKVELSLSHKKREVFYVGRAVQVKAVLLLQPLHLKQYCPFKCILSVLVCPVTLLAQKKIHSVAIEWDICFYATAAACVSGRCYVCIHGHQVCVFLPNTVEHICVTQSYSWI